jgi:hypothetical protein
MTKQQLKSEIQKVLDNVPETVLQDILRYLKELESKPANQLEMSSYLRKILDEDKELLEKLAQ